jgi:hypothetical protein
MAGCEGPEAMADDAEVDMSITVARLPTGRPALFSPQLHRLKWSVVTVAGG